MKSNIRNSCIRSSYFSGRFVSVVALIIASSALPVKSDAFITRASIPNGVALGRPQRNFRHRNTPALNDNQTELCKECVGRSKIYHSAGVAQLRGGGDSESTSLINAVNKFVTKNFFLLGMIVAVSIAKLLPELGKNGSMLRPELFIGKYGVTTIFLISGISLKLHELGKQIYCSLLHDYSRLLIFEVRAYSN